MIAKARQLALRRAPVLALTLSLVPAVSCGPREPPRWAQGGAPIVIPAARWDREDDDVEIRPNGNVLVDGDLKYIIDRVGRVTDEDADPVAILLSDGQLAGTDDLALGRIGFSNASPPGAVEAWLSVGANGAVTYFDSDGERSAGGVWRGCAGPALRTCTLVTHLIALENYRFGPRSGVTFGVGVGVGF